ncbi:MAG: hypothetical protein MUE36_01325 [Acidimicrobiales bacterium]|jgi:hypothetical protein|nr:hypothetical protein [Acidimicrobiales bacterium]
MSDGDPLVQPPEHLQSAIAGDSLLLLDSMAGSTFTFSGGAAFVWTSTVGPPLRPSDIAREMAEDIGGSADDHLPYVQRTVRQLLDQGLLVHARSTTANPRPAPPPIAPSRSRRLAQIRGALAGRSGPACTVATGATTTELVSDDPGDGRFLAAALASMKAETSQPPEHQIATVRSRRAELPFRLFVDGRRRHRAANRDELLRQVVFELNALARAVSGAAVALHAGAVELDGRVLLVAGESGAGKSTLTAALVQRGASYLTDEVAVVRLPSGGVAPFPKPIDLSSTSRRLLGIAPPPEVGGEDPVEKLPLPAPSLGPTSTGGTAAAVLVLDPEPSGPHPIDGPEARATTVLRHAFREPFDQPSGGELLQALVEWSSRTTMVRLGRVPLPAACDVGLGLLASSRAEARTPPGA